MPRLKTSQEWTNFRIVTRGNLSVLYQFPDEDVLFSDKSFLPTSRVASRSRQGNYSPHFFRLQLLILQSDAPAGPVLYLSYLTAIFGFSRCGVSVHPK